MSYNPSPYPIEAPHFVWIIKDQIDKLISEGTLNSRQSLIVRTTLDLDTQHLAEETLRRHIEEFEEQRPDQSQCQQCRAGGHRSASWRNPCARGQR